MRVPLALSILPLAPMLLGCGATGPAPPQQPAGTPAPTSGYDGGFFVRSADGRAELVFEGLFQTTFGLFDSVREPSSDVALKRMRPEFSGRLDSLRFRLEPKFGASEVELEEAWVGAQLMDGRALLMLGRMKAPFNLEEVRSRRHIDFPGFSILNQFAPAEDLGAFLNGRSVSGRWEYGLAVYNGTGGEDTNNSKDVAARLMMHPFSSLADSTWQHFQLGLAGTVGEQDESVAGGSIDNAIGLPVVRYTPAASLLGQRRRAGLEAAWFTGPWFLQSEWIEVRQDMSAGLGVENAAFSGGYLTLARVLTGEDKDFGGVRPDQPFDFDHGTGRGAWVLALRLSDLSLDEDLVGAGLVAPGGFTDRIRSVSLGLNWIPNQHSTLRHALTWSRYDDEVDLGDGRSDDELALVVEFQVHF